MSNDVNDAIDVLILLLGVSANILAQVEKVSSLIRDARAAGRELTAEELDVLREARLAARAAAVSA